MGNFVTKHLRGLLDRAPRRRALPPIGIQVLGYDCVLLDAAPADGGPMRARITNIEAGDRQELATALAERVQHDGLVGRPAHLVLGSADYSIIQLDRPEVEDAELAEALRWQIGEHVDYAAEEALLQVLEMPEPSTSRRVLQVVAAHRPRLEALATLLDDAQLRPMSMSIGELALRDLIAATDYQDTALATVLLRQDSGILNITRGGTLFFTRRLPSAAIGGEVGTALWNQMVSQVARDIGNAAGYFERQLGQAPVTATLLVTTDTHAEALNRSIGEALEMPVRSLDPRDLSGIAFDPPAHGDLARGALAAGITHAMARRA